MIKEGIKSLNSDLKKINKRLRAGIIIRDGYAGIYIYYVRFLKKEIVGEISKNAFNMVNLKLINSNEDDFKAIEDAITVFGTKYL